MADTARSKTTKKKTSRARPKGKKATKTAKAAGGEEQTARQQGATSAVAEKTPQPQSAVAKVEDASVQKPSAPAVEERKPSAAKSPVASPEPSDDGPTPIQQLMRTKSFRDLVIAKLVRKLR